MKLGLLVGALAVALGAVGCGSNGGGECGPNGDDCPASPVVVSGSSSGGMCGDDAGAEGAEGGSGGGGSSSGSSSGSAGGSSSGATAPSTGTCVPGIACGGVYECTNACYSSACCSLSCYCSDSSGQSGTLDCAMACP